MHRIDWRVAVAAASIGVIILVVAIVAFGGSDTDETVRAGGDDEQSEEPAVSDAELEAPTATAEPPTPIPATDDEAAAAPEPTATEAPTATVAPTAPPEPTSTPVPAPTATTAPPPTPTAPPPDDGTLGGGHPIPGEGCVVFLHGAGFPTPAYTEDWGDKTFIFPVSGNPEWPHFWLYDGPFLDYETDADDSSYNAMVAIVRQAIDENNCGPVFITGVSNGGGFLAKMYCRGEDFGGRLFAVHVDDPVPDAGVVGCNPSPSVIRTMFTHSTELAEEARTFDNGRCTSTDSEYGPWYCEDDTALTLEQYEAEIGEQSILSRPDHSGPASDETSFWQIVTPWFHDYDPTRFNPQ